jgi:putative protease
VTVLNPITPPAVDRRAELLLPAGDLERLQTALLYGADAVYAGTPDMSLRTHSGFSLEELREGVALAHEQGRRVYLTLNLFSHNKDIAKLPDYVATLRQIGPDGVLVADLGVFQYLREHAPELRLHVSTQANVTNWLAVKSWQALGAVLCVLAREVSFEEIREIRSRCPGIRLETFVHGSMCMTYSGRCLLSNYLAERGANQGSCAHSCRWKYQLKVLAPDGNRYHVELNERNLSDYQFYLEEEFRPGQLFPLEEDASGSYILNSRDLCLMPKLDQYLALGLDSLKVEGRNKSAYYVAVVGRAYRLAIDAYYRDPLHFDPAPYLAELQTVASRGYTLGFHTGRLAQTAHDVDGGQSLSDFEFAGVVRAHEHDALVLEVRNQLKSGDVLEFLPPHRLDSVRLRVYEFENAETGEHSPKFNAGERRAIRIAWSAFHSENTTELKRLLPPFSVVRKAKLLTVTQSEQLENNRLALRLETDPTHSESLRTTTSPAPTRESPKPPRIGAAGCCGLGCNGCLPFWNDEQFAKAREQLLSQRNGKLDKSSKG